LHHEIETGHTLLSKFASSKKLCATTVVPYWNVVKLSQKLVIS